MKLLQRPSPMSPVACLSEHEQELFTIDGIHCSKYVEDVGGLPLGIVHAQLLKEVSELPLTDRIIDPSSNGKNRAFVLRTDIERIVYMQRQLAGYGIRLSLDNPEIYP
jgi:hypothetical protein